MDEAGDMAALAIPFAAGAAAGRAEKELDKPFPGML